MKTADLMPDRPEDVLWNSVRENIDLAFGRFGISIDAFEAKHHEFDNQPKLGDSKLASDDLLDFYNVWGSKNPAAFYYLLQAFMRYRSRYIFLQDFVEANQELLVAAETKMLVAFSLAALNMQDEAIAKFRKNGASGGSVKSVNTLVKPLKVWATNQSKAYPATMSASEIARKICSKGLPERFKEVKAKDPQRIIADAIRASRNKT